MGDKSSSIEENNVTSIDKKIFIITIIGFDKSMIS